MDDDELAAGLMKEAEKDKPTDYRTIYIGVTVSIAIIWLIALLVSNS
jgi:hypothetical protein